VAVPETVGRKRRQPSTATAIPSPTDRRVTAMKNTAKQIWEIALFIAAVFAVALVIELQALEAMSQ